MKIINIIVSGILIIFLFNSCQKSSSTKIVLNNNTDSLTYALGISFGNYLKMNNIDEVDPELLVAVFKSVMNDESLIMNAQDANIYMNKYMQKKFMAIAQKNLEEGKAFLEKNKNEEGVVVLESGLQYKVLKEGSGPSPKATDIVSTFYKGTLLNGTVFDSTGVEKPRKFSPNRVIPGWKEAIQLMKVGSKWQLFIPSNMGYGKRPPRGSNIEPNMVLIFEMELVAIEEPKTTKNKK